MVPILYHTKVCYVLGSISGLPIFFHYLVYVVLSHLQSLQLYNRLSSGKVSISLPLLNSFFQNAFSHILLFIITLTNIGVVCSVLCVSHVSCCPKEKLSLQL